MKKTSTLALAFLTSATVVFAQPTLRQSNTSPLPGEGFFGHIVDSAGLAGAQLSGPGVTWNFPVLAETGMDTNYYYNCGATPYCGSFLEGNIVSLIDSSFEYGESDSNSFSFMGWASSSGVNHFLGRQVWMVYPFTYGSSYKDTLSIVESVPGSYYDSIYVIDSFFADGYGTLILPTGTYTNVLRVHHISLELDSFRYSGLDSGSTYGRMDNYSWFDTSGFHNPLLSVGYDTSGSTTPYIYNAEYYSRAPMLPLELPNPSITDMSFSIYPNPTNDFMTITFTLTDNKPSTISLLDVVGRVVIAVNCDQLNTGTNKVVLSTTTVPPGIYIVKLQNSQDNLTHKVVITR